MCLTEIISPSSKFKLSDICTNLDNTPQIQNKPNQNKPKWLLVGYMEHDPKTEALKNKQK